TCLADRFSRGRPELELTNVVAKCPFARSHRFVWIQPNSCQYLRGSAPLAPVHAVICRGCWQPANLPVTQRIEIDGFRIYWIHILAELDPQAADKIDAVIYGHSRQPKIESKNGTLFFNPGSAGPRRFRLPITVGRMTAEHGKLRAEIVELSV